VIAVFKVTMETAKIGEVMNMVNSVSYTLKTNAHINQLITAAHRIISNEFIIHMSQVAFGSQKQFEHMYEWGRVGDPNARLWKNILRGTGSARVSTFDFKASKKAVPVKPIKQEVGVKGNHIFVWKAPILELGLPVRISPKIASTLVMDYPKGAGVLAYTKRTIYIARQGNPQVWGEFTNEFMRYFGGPKPAEIIKTQLEPKVTAGVKQAMRIGITQLTGKSKTKTIEITPIGIDKNFVTTLNNSLKVNYIESARNRRVDE
jgi:hypothetical protein